MVSHYGFDFCELSISFSCLLSWCFFGWLVCLFGDFFLCFVTCLKILYTLGILIPHLWCMMQMFNIFSLFDSCLLTLLPWWLSSKEAVCNAGNPVLSLGQEDPLEKGMATHSSILAWEIPWTEEPGGLMVQRVPKSQTQLSTKLALWNASPLIAPNGIYDNVYLYTCRLVSQKVNMNSFKKLIKLQAPETSD